MDDPGEDDIYSNSGTEVSEEDPCLLAPSDGYFHRHGTGEVAADNNISAQGPASRHPTFSPIPSVPNAIIIDPTLSIQPDHKRRAAQQQMSAEPGIEALTTSHASSASLFASQLPSRTADDHAIDQSSGMSSMEPGQSLNLVNGESAQDTVSSLDTSESPASRSRLGTSMNAYGAPPAYSPSSSQNIPSTIAATESAEVREQRDVAVAVDERTPLLATRPPTTAGTEDADAQESKPYMLSIFQQQKSLNIALSVLVVILLFVILVLVVARDNQPSGDYEIVDRSPIRQPDAVRPDLKWQSMQGCRDTPTSRRTMGYATVLKADRSFHVRQERNNRINGNFPIEVYGEIVIRPWVNSTQTPTLILFESISNDDRFKAEVTMSDSSMFDSFTMSISNNVDSWDSRDGKPCLQGRITVAIPPGSIVQSFVVSSTNFDIQIENGLHMGAETGAEVASAGGFIIAPELSDINSRVLPYTIQAPRMTLSTTGHGMKGWFPLYNKLDISAVGDLDLQVTPKEGVGRKSNAAHLNVQTYGNINLTQQYVDGKGLSMRPVAFPGRDYVSRISAIGGNVRARILSSSSTIVSTTKGNLDLDLLPVFNAAGDSPGSGPPRIVTNVNDGNANIKIHEPRWWSNKRHRQPTDRMGLRDLVSRHNIMNGSLNVSYASSWSGSVNWHSINAAVHIEADVFEVIRSIEGPITIIEGRRGSGYSDMGIEIANGSGYIELES